MHSLVDFLLVTLFPPGYTPQIRELILDNCKATNLDGLAVGFTNLVSLSLNAVGLVSLENFPALASLRRLELSDNKISGGLQRLVLSSKLKRLNLSNNRIKDLPTIEPLVRPPATRVPHNMPLSLFLGVGFC